MLLQDILISALDLLDEGDIENAKTAVETARAIAAMLEDSDIFPVATAEWNHQLIAILTRDGKIES